MLKNCISIDPGKYKCGVVLADIEQKIVLQAIVIESLSLLDLVIDLKKKSNISKLIMGGGTTCKEHIESLKILNDDFIIVNERNTTLRAKKRYFELFPKKGLQKLLPKELIIMDMNLDAISALIILEDHLNIKFNLGSEVNSKTWMKQ